MVGALEKGEFSDGGDYRGIVRARTLARRPRLPGGVRNVDIASQIRAEWADTIRAFVLAKTDGGAAGHAGVGSGAETARIPADCGWKDTTCTNRTSHLRKWLSLCEEEGRRSLPAEEGDVLAYMRYLSLEGQVGPRYAQQYVTMVCRYH